MTGEQKTIETLWAARKNTQRMVDDIDRILTYQQLTPENRQILTDICNLLEKANSLLQKF